MGDHFDKALAHTLQFEGGYANDPADSGGETYKGISRNNWPSWPGWKLIDEAKVQGHRSAKAINHFFANHAAMAALISDFYNHQFWEKTK